MISFLLKNRLILLTIICIPTFIIISLNKPNSSKAIYSVEYERFWTRKVHVNCQFDVVVIGNSRVYRGIAPQYIEKALPGSKVLNFGFSSGLLNEEIYNEAYKRLNKNSKLKVIIVGYAPGCFTNGENKQFHEILNYSKSEIFDKMYTNYYLSKITTPMKPSDIFYKKKGLEYVREVFNDNGWVLSESSNPDPSKLIETYRNGWNGLSINYKHIRDLYEKIELWKKEDILVFVFRVPTTIEMEKLENELSNINDTIIKEQVIKYGGYWIDLNKPYEKYFSYDGSHLDGKSAIKLSEDIGKEISRMISSK